MNNCITCKKNTTCTLEVQQKLQTLMEQGVILGCAEYQHSGVQPIKINFKKYFPTPNEIPTSKKIEFAKQALATEFARFLINNDYVSVKYLGLDKFTESEVYEADFVFLTEDKHDA